MLACFVKDKKPFFSDFSSSSPRMCILLKAYPPVLFINNRLNGLCSLRGELIHRHCGNPDREKAGMETQQSYPHLLWII
jgi:hypothetical protein